jgi:hypothetical protein
MNSLFSILLKNAILIAIIAISLIFMFTPYIGYKEIKYIFLGMGIAFVLASCLEAYILSKVKNGTQKFLYFTDGFLAKRVIKIISFTGAGLLMYYAGKSMITYMAFLCFLVAFTEIIVTAWRYIKNLCFVALEDDQLILSTNKIDVIHAKEIEKIEYRHGLTYFVKYNKKAMTLRTDLMSQNAEFTIALNSWITKNNLTNKVISA